MSYFLPERNALFLHIPRTGGTWVGHSIDVAGIPIQNWGRVCEMYRPRKHTILSHYRPDLLSKVKWIFSFVRRPCEYYVTNWRFTTRSVVTRPEKMKNTVFNGKNSAAINEAVNRWKPNFDEWLDEMLEEEPAWVTRWFERFVGPHRGEFCHFIGRTETLREDMNKVMKILDYEEEWKKASASIDEINHAKNQIRRDKAPRIELTGNQRVRIERSERVMLRRFFGRDTLNKRVYRNLEGEPV